MTANKPMADSISRARTVPEGSNGQSKSAQQQPAITTPTNATSYFDKRFVSTSKGFCSVSNRPLPYFRRHGGSIILNASVASSKGFGMSTVYSRNLRVNAISPGTMDPPVFSTGIDAEEQIDPQTFQSHQCCKYSR
jgi:hypothetical protein